MRADLPASRSGRVREHLGRQPAAHRHDPRHFFGVRDQQVQPRDGTLAEPGDVDALRVRAVPGHDLVDESREELPASLELVGHEHWPLRRDVTWNQA